MVCISPMAEDQPTAQTDESTTTLHPQRYTCYVHRYRRWEDDHFQLDLEENEEYFFVIATPSDPRSIVKVSDTLTTATRQILPNLPSPTIASEAALAREENVTLANPRKRPWLSPPPWWDYDTDGDVTLTQGIGNTGDDEVVAANSEAEAMMANETPSTTQPPAPTRRSDGEAPSEAITPHGSFGTTGVPCYVFTSDFS